MMIVESTISKELKKQGFIQKGKRLLYLRKSDIIALFSFERPTDALYLQFAIVPLFLPCPGHITYSFGGRLDSLFYDLPIIEKNTAEEQLREYCILAMEHIEKDVLPVVYQYSTAASLNEFARRKSRFIGRNSTRLLLCTPLDTLKLLLYSSLFLKDYHGAENAAKRLGSYIHSCKYYTLALKEQMLSKNNQIITLLDNMDYRAVETIISRNIKENLSLFEA